MRRNAQQREALLEDIMAVMDTASDWVKTGYVIRRVRGISSNTAKAYLRELTKRGSLVRIGGGGSGAGHYYRYAIPGRFDVPEGTVEVRAEQPTNPEQPNNNHRWLPAEEQQLVDEVRAGLTQAEMAKRHGRTEAAIYARLYTLAQTGRIKWNTRTGTGEVMTDSLSPVPTNGGSLTSQVLALESLADAVGAFLDGDTTLNELREAYANTEVSA